MTLSVERRGDAETAENIAVDLCVPGGCLADRYLFSGFGGAIGVTVMRLFNFRKLFSPTPRTFMISSTFLNPPFFWRYWMMRSAVFGPIPGSVAICAAEAVLRLMMSLDVVETASLPGLAAFCASTGDEMPSASTAISRNGKRFIVSS